MALDESEFKVAAMKAVMVVPMLAPIIKGAAFFNVTTRWATSGTTNDVVMVEERIAAVVVIPQKNAFQLFLKNRPLNCSVALDSIKPEIIFLKMSMEANSN